MPIPLLAMLPAIIAAIGGVTSTVASGESNRKMKKYNDPLRQLQRLNRAGLPMAAMGNNIANTQSSLPDFRGISDAGNALGSFMQNVQMQGQIDLLKENLRGAQIGNDMSYLDYLLKKEDTDWSMEPDPGFMDGRSRRRNEREMDYEVKGLDTDLKRQKYEIDTLENTLNKARYGTGDMDSLWRAGFDKILKENRRLDQEWDNVNKRNAASDKIMEYFNKGGLGLMEAIFLAFVQSKGLM